MLSWVEHEKKFYNLRAWFERVYYGSGKKQRLQADQASQIRL